MPLSTQDIKVLSQPDLDRIRTEVEAFQASSPADLEHYKSHFLGKNGLLPHLFHLLRAVATEEKRKWGPLLNALRETVDSTYKRHLSGLSAHGGTSALQNAQDLTLSAAPVWQGSRHPISLVLSDIINFFQHVGYRVSDGPEIEDDQHNFTALNFPKDHPARDMQDTFFLHEAGVLLRTHTSSAQIRLMKETKPPFAFLVPGKVYRNETLSARAHCMFHQVEGLYVAKDATFSLLRDTLYTFSQHLFGDQTQVRLRPSYFPFTQPSAELDISCVLCGQSGCKLCKHTGWLEIGGCGMVHPNVFENCQVDANTWTGLAFGIGIERIAMLKYQIEDIRSLTTNDVRFLDQFKTA